MQISSTVWPVIIAGLFAIAVALLKILADRLKKMAKVGESTHILVNSNMGTQLKITAIALRRLAILTNDKEDSEAATLAERLYIEHQTKQSVVDSKSELFKEVPFNKM